jgi:DNA repair exonuclease SbcCD ATPase subunit
MKVQELESQNASLSYEYEKLAQNQYQKEEEGRDLQKAQEKEREARWKRDKEKEWKTIVAKWKEVEEEYREEINQLKKDNEELTLKCSEFEDRWNQEREEKTQVEMELKNLQADLEERIKSQHRAQVAPKQESGVRKIIGALDNMHLQQQVLVDKVHSLMQQGEARHEELVTKFQTQNANPASTSKLLSDVLKSWTPHFSQEVKDLIETRQNDDLNDKVASLEEKLTIVSTNSSEQYLLLQKVASDITQHLSRPRTRARTSTTASVNNETSKATAPSHNSSQGGLTLHNSLNVLQQQLEHNTIAHKDTFQKLDSILKVADFVNSTQCQLMKLFAEHIQGKQVKTETEKQPFVTHSSSFKSNTSPFRPLETDTKYSTKTFAGSSTKGKELFFNISSLPLLPEGAKTQTSSTLLSSVMEELDKNKRFVS